MRVSIRFSIATLLALASLATYAATEPDSAKPYARDPAQPVDRGYTK